MNNLQPEKACNSNPWNPFEPTQRDIERTEQLAEKNRMISGIFAYCFPIITMIYLGRGVNTLKILAYTFLSIMAIVLVCPELEEDTYEGIAETVGFVAAIAITWENVNTINQARERNKKSQSFEDLDI